jgi:hypothetical protein
MGGGVGLTIGFIFGSYSILRYVTFMKLKSNVMNDVFAKGWPRTARILGHAFPVHAQQCRNVFVLPGHWIGENISVIFRSLTITEISHYDLQVIRSDALMPPHLEAARMQLLSPMIRSKADGAVLTRARWDAERRLRGVPKID